MICLQKYASPVNFSFHSEKTSRFPWNLEYKKRDLKFSLTNLWSMKCFVKYTLPVNLSKIRVNKETMNYEFSLIGPCYRIILSFEKIIAGFQLTKGLIIFC